jgi:hypothetical protein
MASSGRRGVQGIAIRRLEARPAARQRGSDRRAFGLQLVIIRTYIRYWYSWDMLLLPARVAHRRNALRRGDTFLGVHGVQLPCWRIFLYKSRWPVPFRFGSLGKVDRPSTAFIDNRDDDGWL